MYDSLLSKLRKILKIILLYSISWFLMSHPKFSHVCKFCLSGNVGQIFTTTVQLGNTRADTTQQQVAYAGRCCILFFFLPQDLLMFTIQVAPSFVPLTKITINCKLRCHFITNNLLWVLKTLLKCTVLFENTIYF